MTTNEQLMHATIAIAARCARRDPKPTEEEMTEIAREAAAEFHLDDACAARLCRAAVSIVAPVEDPDDPVRQRHNAIFVAAQAIIDAMNECPDVQVAMWALTHVVASMLHTNGISLVTFASRCQALVSEMAEVAANAGRSEPS